MNDDLLGTVKAALAIVPELHIDDWSMAYTDGLRTSRITGRMLRALVTRCAQAEAEVERLGRLCEIRWEILTTLQVSHDALRQRHAKAVEAAYYDGVSDQRAVEESKMFKHIADMWLASEAKARLT